MLLFSIIATIVLQEMAARLGLVSREGLGEAIRGSFSHPIARGLSVLLVVAAITCGNAVYQAGNITGATMGLGVIVGGPPWAWAIAVGTGAALLLMTGIYRVIERVLIALVVLMSAVFLTMAVMSGPDPSAMVSGMFTPRVPAGSLTTVIALIGTTVVPYNLFLHASAVREKWSASSPLAQSLAQSRVDTALAVTLGGGLTLAIVVTASAFFARGATIESAADMAGQLEPLLGRWAQAFFAVGLMAAGLTSAITAPLAAAYATSGALGWSPDLRSRRFRAVWLGVILAGTLAAATLGGSPTQTIIFAQVANGLLLPFIAVFLLVVMNRKRLMGSYANGWSANVLGGAVVLVVSGLGVWKLRGVVTALLG